MLLKELMHHNWRYVESSGGQFEGFMGRKFDLGHSRATSRVNSVSPSIPMMQYDSYTSTESSKGARELSEYLVLLANDAKSE